MAYELVEFWELTLQPGQRFDGHSETVLGHYDDEHEAIEHGRIAWRSGRSAGSSDVVWWIVRVPGEQLARWLADGGSDREQVLDLTTNSLVAIQD